MRDRARPFTRVLLYKGILPVLKSIVHGVSGNSTERLPVAVEHLRVEHVLERNAQMKQAEKERYSI